MYQPETLVNLTSKSVVKSILDTPVGIQEIIFRELKCQVENDIRKKISSDINKTLPFLIQEITENLHESNNLLIDIKDILYYQRKYNNVDPSVVKCAINTAHLLLKTPYRNYESEFSSDNSKNDDDDDDSDSNASHGYGMDPDDDDDDDVNDIITSETESDN